MINNERVLERFLDYIKISSESKNEKDFADRLIKDLEGLGLEITRDNSKEAIGGNCSNVIAKLKGNKQGDPILFSCHMDTVSPGNNIKPIVKDGVVYSDGTTILGGDDKAGIASLLEAITHLKESGESHVDIEFIFTVAEEIGLCGSKNLDYSKIKSKKGFILDSGGEIGTIINKGPAQDKIEVKIVGKPAHAGVAPETGISAINVAAHAISKMNLLRIDEETTANIGTISGGVATNIVCPEVKIDAEARSINEEKLNKQTKHMVDIFKETAKEFNAEAIIDVTRMYGGFNLPEDDEVIKIAKSAFENLGYEVNIQGSGGGSDTNVFNKNGIKAINLAIGERKPHTLEECYHVEDLVKVSNMVVEIIKNA